MKKLSVSRRVFNKTFAGLSAGAYVQFTGLLRDAFVHAQGATSLRLICLTQPHGKTVLWHPRAPGGGYGSAGETGWTLSFPNSSLSPLEKHKDSLVIIEGLDHYCLRKPGNENAIGHQGAPCALTGTNIISNNDRRPTGPSIDTVVARHLEVDPFVFYPGAAVCKSWDATGNVYPDVGAGGGYEPLNFAFKKLFGNLTTPGSMPDPRATRARDVESSTLKFLREDATMLRGRLAGPERLKLDLHLEAIASMEKKLTTTVSAGCRKPTAPTGRDYTLSMEVKHKLVIDYIAAAFACNLTRVATAHMGGHASYPGVPGHAHNDVVHGNAYADPNQANTILSSTIHRWDAANTAYLIEQLQSFSEGGKTLYDNTIILSVNELGNAGPHQAWNLPILLAGRGGSWAKGRYLKVRDVTVAANGLNSRGDIAAAHNHLLVSVANQFGIPDQTFGDKDISGPLKGL